MDEMGADGPVRGSHARPAARMAPRVAAAHEVRPQTARQLLESHQGSLLTLVAPLSKEKPAPSRKGGFSFRCRFVTFRSRILQSRNADHSFENKKRPFLHPQIPAFRYLLNLGIVVSNPS